MKRYISYPLLFVLGLIFLGAQSTDYLYLASEEEKVKKEIEIPPEIEVAEEAIGEAIEVVDKEKEVKKEITAFPSEETAEERMEVEAVEEEAAVEVVKAEEEVKEEMKKEVAPEMVESEAVEVTEPEVEVKPEEDEEVGPDTVTLSEEKIGFRGNWVKKREWLLRAKSQNNKIQTLADEVKKSRPSFREKFNKIQNELDEFYRDVGKVEGKLELVQKTLEQVGKEEEVLPKEKPAAIEVPWYRRWIDTFLDVTDWIYDKIKEGLKWIVGKKEKVSTEVSVKGEVRRIHSTGDEELFQQSELESLRKNIKTIRDLDDALVKRMDKLAEQISMVNNEANRSRVLFDEIWDIIDDTKAQANFYGLKTITKQVKSVKEYIEDDFARDFDVTIETVRIEISKVKEGIKALEERGFISTEEVVSEEVKEEVVKASETKNEEVGEETEAKS